VKPFAAEKLLLPSFPRTAHLPFQPNATADDVIATADEASLLFEHPVNIEEKIDGASVGMALHEGEALIRNRDHVLRKGYLKDTPAKLQFRPVWGWFYEHREGFRRLAEHGRFSVYGDWCLMQHGIEYSRLPDWFIAYDLYDQDERAFVPPGVARAWLEEAGFTVPRLLHQGPLGSLGYEDLARLTQLPGDWTRDGGPIEGIYLKVHDGGQILGRFKMVRSDFVPGALWDPEHVLRNALASKVA
jgi:atypical dual specificity phosphatase